jgi:Cu2+-exporting ATPase
MPATIDLPAPPGVREYEPCAHCGAANPHGARWTAQIGGESRRFCCGGCLAVATTLEAAGLERLDAARIRGPVEGHRPGDDEWIRWAAGARAAGLVHERTDGLHETALLLDGMTCGACVVLLETWLARQPGIAAASVNYANRRAQVRWDPEVADLSAVLRAIAVVGYAAYAYDPARREALARRERGALLTRAAIALLAMMQVMMLAWPAYTSMDGVAPEQQRLLDWASLVLTLPVLFYCATPLFASAWRDVTRGRVGMDVPITLGIAAAFAASAWAIVRGGGPVYFDSVTMFVALLLVARYCELVARQNASAAIEAIARQRPDTAERLPAWPAATGVETVAAATLARDDIVLVRPGALVPADGVVIEGQSHVEEAMLTGESAAHLRVPGDRAWAGAVNRESALVLRVEAAGEATRLAAILRLTEHAATARPAVARIADRIATIFVSVLLLLAALTALAWWYIDPVRMPAIAFAVLVVSCPCALALATPTALAAAAGSLARRGVMFARADAFETLARVTHVVLDKTGTLTEGRLRLAGWQTLDPAAGDALRIAGALERQSEHPLARALVEAAGVADAPSVTGLQQVTGAGIAATVDGTPMRIGSLAFVAALAGPMPAAGRRFAGTLSHAETLVALGAPGRWIALFALADTLRPGAQALLADLRGLGLHALLLSGDRAETVAALAATLRIDDARGELSPAAKADAIAALQREGAVVAMVGDGVNDAPALAQAQVSMSLGSATPLAQFTADVVVLPDRLALIAAAVTDARRTLRIIRQNLAWAVLYNAIAIPAAAFGWVTPLAAAAGMSLSSLVVVGNALRLTRARTGRSAGVARSGAAAAGA